MSCFQRILQQQKQAGACCAWGKYEIVSRRGRWNCERHATEYRSDNQWRQLSLMLKQEKGRLCRYERRTSEEEEGIRNEEEKTTNAKQCSPIREIKQEKALLW